MRLHCVIRAISKHSKHHKNSGLSHDWAKCAPVIIICCASCALNVVTKNGLLIKKWLFLRRLLLTLLKIWLCTFQSVEQDKNVKVLDGICGNVSVLESNQGFQILSLIHNHYDNEVST